MVVNNLGGHVPPIKLKCNFIGSLISGLFGLGASAYQSSKSKEIADQQIAAQQESNKQNIDFARWATEYDANAQNAINQQNIDFQKGVNSLMRDDQLHQQSNKVRDLKASGMSTASSDGNGFTAAALAAPQLTAPTATAPHVDSEFSPAAASVLQGASSRLADLIADLPEKIISNRRQLADAKGKEQANATYEELMTHTFAKMDVEMQNLLSHSKLNDYQRFKVVEETKLFQQQFKLFTEQIRQAKFTSDNQQEEFNLRMSNFLANTKAALSSSYLNDTEREFKKLSIDYQDIVNDYARVGIRFESSDIIDTIARLLHSGGTKELIGDLRSFLFDVIDSLNPFSSRSDDDGIPRVATETDSLGNPVGPIPKKRRHIR